MYIEMAIQKDWMVIEIIIDFKVTEVMVIQIIINEGEINT